MKTVATVFLLSALVCASPMVHAQAPPAPTLLSITASFYYVPDIYVSWHSSSNSVGAESYRIYRSLGDSSHFELVGTSYYPTYVDFQILGGQLYYYYVTANVFVDTTRYESDRSSYVSATAVQQGGGGGGSKRKNNGTISGRVTDSLSGKPITAVQVLFYRVSSSGVPVQKVLSDGSGHYRAALDTGTYVVKAHPPLSGGSPVYNSEWYSNASGPADATPIRVDDTSRIVANFDLTKPGVGTPVTVSGAVMDSAGSPLPGARVLIVRSIQDMEDRSSSGDEVVGLSAETVDIDGLGHAQGVVWQGGDDSAGHFQATVAAGTSYVVLASKPGYAPQFFNHQSNPTMADPLRLTGDTSGINFNLRAFSPSAVFSVMGTVSDSNGVHVPSRIVLVPVPHQSSDLSSVFTYTDSLGAFAVTHVRAGKYIALGLPFSLYAPAYYRAGAFGIAEWQQADTINVAGNVTGIDIGVTRITIGGFNHVDGRITSGGIPVRGVNVYAAFSNGSIAGYSLTDDNGFYSLSGLPSEKVTLSGDLNGFQATQTSVSAPAGSLFVSGVDLVLSPFVATSVPTANGLAREFVLEQNYPNPFNPTTGIRVQVSGDRDIRLVVYDLLGRQIAVLANGRYSAGEHSFTFDGTNLASGVYFYRLTAGTYTATKAMVLTK